jgi:hypothetical protein
VDASGCPELEQGGTYLVEYVVPGLPDAPGFGTGEGDGLILAGVLDERGLISGYRPERFRPIYRPKHELISRLLSDVPAKVDA